MQGMGGNQMLGAFPFYSVSVQVSEKKMTHGSVCTDQWPPPSARRLSCQDNCCQDMLVFLGNNFSVLFLYSKPSPTSMWEAVGVLAPCGDWERVAREDKSSYQRGICGPREICTSFMVCQTVIRTLKTEVPELGASSSHEIKMNSQACNILKNI